MKHVFYLAIIVFVIIAFLQIRYYFAGKNPPLVLLHRNNEKELDIGIHLPFPLKAKKRDIFYVDENVVVVMLDSHTLNSNFYNASPCGLAAFLNYKYAKKYNYEFRYYQLHTYPTSDLNLTTCVHEKAGEPASSICKLRILAGMSSM